MAEFSSIIQGIDHGHLEQSLSALLRDMAAVVFDAQEPAALILRFVASPGREHKGRDRRIIDLAITAERPGMRAVIAKARLFLRDDGLLGELLLLDEMQAPLLFEEGQ